LNPEKEELQMVKILKLKTPSLNKKERKKPLKNERVILIKMIKFNEKYYFRFLVDLNCEFIY